MQPSVVPCTSLLRTRKGRSCLRRLLLWHWRCRKSFVVSLVTHAGLPCMSLQRSHVDRPPRRWETPLVQGGCKECHNLRPCDMEVLNVSNGTKGPSEGAPRMIFSLSTPTADGQTAHYSNQGLRGRQSTRGHGQRHSIMFRRWRRQGSGARCGCHSFRGRNARCDDGRTISV